jgi:hypothetical protein
MRGLFVCPTHVYSFPECFVLSTEVSVHAQELGDEIAVPVSLMVADVSVKFALFGAY